MIESAERGGLTLAVITARLGGNGHGDPSLRVYGLASLQKAEAQHISFISHPRYRDAVKETKAGIVVLKPEWQVLREGAFISTIDPYLYYARLSQWFAELKEPSLPAVHKTAVVDSPLPPSVTVGPLSTIGARCRIGAGTRIGAHCAIGEDVEIGENCLLHAGVTIYSGCRLGNRAIVHSGAVIGADGFGFASNGASGWVKIMQIGRVDVGDDVEIGANTTIDRGALDDTIIGDGVKLDNQIQVGHNVHIGAHTAMAGGTAVAGGAKVGPYCMIGGSSAINSYVSIAGKTVISGFTGVDGNVDKPGRYTGTFPMVSHADWGRIAVTLRHLPEWMHRLRKLEKGSK